jgi:benzoyl-CoA reductase/2-hydroxyglutaryl-CoA dehydratase subunit BcrC/BadD/HgdB
VYYVLQFCHELNTEYAKVERALKAEGVPVIKIDIDLKVYMLCHRTGRRGTPHLHVRGIH